MLHANILCGDQQCLAVALPAALLQSDQVPMRIFDLPVRARVMGCI